jgi:hypothetical protein
MPGTHFTSGRGVGREILAEKREELWIFFLADTFRLKNLRVLHMKFRETSLSASSSKDRNNLNMSYMLNCWNTQHVLQLHMFCFNFENV